MHSGKGLHIMAVHNTNQINRRSFITGAALATGGLALAQSATAAFASEGSSGQDQGADASGASDASAQEQSSSLVTSRPWETKPDPIPNDQIVETYDADIVVIGAGVAGVCAAQSAAEEGASVIVLEKTAQANARGLDIGSINNQFQKDNPDIAQYIDASEAERIYYEFSHSSVNRLLFRHWAQHSGEAFDHLANYLKENYDLEPAMSATANPSVFEASDYYREMPTCQSFGEGWFDADGNWQMVGVVNKVVKWAEDLGATFIYNTPAEQLVQDESGAVTGVVAKGPDGYVKANASKGVIIATGDISGNPDMLKAWCPIGARCKESVYTPQGANTGDGLAMGMWAGAAAQHGYPAPMIHPMGSGGPLAQSGDYLGFCASTAKASATRSRSTTPRAWRTRALSSRARRPTRSLMPTTRSMSSR
jgi:fumarate reductase flavoprotein subunit